LSDCWGPRLSVYPSLARVWRRVAAVVHLGHSIVVGQFLCGNTFEIGYVEDRLESHDRSGRVQSVRVALKYDEQ